MQRPIYAWSSHLNRPIHENQHGSALTVLCAASYGTAQDTPLISGGVGFFTSTKRWKHNLRADH